MNTGKKSLIKITSTIKSKISLFLKEIRLLKVLKFMSIENIINEAWENKDQISKILIALSLMQ